jgi:hypothetical protein
VKARILSLFALLVLVVALPAMAQAAAPTVDPAHQAYLAGILRFVGKAMQDHAEDWAGIALLAFPPLTGLIGWLMPREWLFKLAGVVGSPVLALLGMGKAKGGK